jgi:hypothetical protein
LTINCFCEIKYSISHKVSNGVWNVMKPTYQCVCLDNIFGYQFTPIYTMLRDQDHGNVESCQNTFRNHLCMDLGCQV